MKINLNKTSYILIKDINKTEINEVKDRLNEFKGENQYKHIVDFTSFVKLANENGFTINNFPTLDGAYNFSLNTSSTNDYGCFLKGEAATNPLIKFKEKLLDLNYKATLTLDDYYGIYLHQYLSSDEKWLFSVMYLDDTKEVSFGLYYYEANNAKALSETHYKELVNERLSISNFEGNSFFKDTYDKLKWFSSPKFSENEESRVRFKQLKNKAGNNIIQLEASVETFEAATEAINSINNIFKMAKFNESEVTSGDKKIKQFTKEIETKSLNVQADYRSDSQNSIPFYTVMVLFYI